MSNLSRESQQQQQQAGTEDDDDNVSESESTSSSSSFDPRRHTKWHVYQSNDINFCDVVCVGTVRDGGLTLSCTLPDKEIREKRTRLSCWGKRKFLFYVQNIRGVYK